LNEKVLSGLSRFIKGAKMDDNCSIIVLLW